MTEISYCFESLSDILGESLDTFYGELTRQKLWQLSRFIQTEEDFGLLAGYLGIPPFEIKKNLWAEWDIGGAIYKTFRSWFNQQPDRTSAYSNMCEALTKADMINLIKVLD